MDALRTGDGVGVEVCSRRLKWPGPVVNVEPFDRTDPSNSSTVRPGGIRGRRLDAPTGQ